MEKAVRKEPDEYPPPNKFNPKNPNLTILKDYPKVLGRPEWKEVLRRWKKLEKAVPRDPEEEPSPSNFIIPWTTPGTWSRSRQWMWGGNRGCVGLRG